MKSRIQFHLFLLILCSPFCFANEVDELPEVKKLQRGMPEAVASFISRTVECQHWGGEYPYDQERREWIEKAVARARCGDLEKDEKDLQSKYEKDSQILEAIEKSKHLDLW